MAPRKKKYALIWWIDSEYKDVIDLQAVPQKFREVNSTACLKWLDHKTKAITNARAKVLAISDNRDKLESIIVDARGVINDDSSKIFSSTIIKEKHKFVEQAKMRKHITKSNNRQLEKKIRKEKPLFDKENYSSELANRALCDTISPRKQNQSTIKKKDEHKPQDDSEMSQNNIPTTTGNLHSSSCIQNIHRENENRIRISDTFVSQPNLYESYSTIYTAPSHDRLDDRNIYSNLENSKNKEERATQAYYSQPFDTFGYPSEYRSTQWEKNSPVQVTFSDQSYNNSKQSCLYEKEKEPPQDFNVSLESNYTLDELKTVSSQSSAIPLHDRVKSQQETTPSYSHDVTSQNITRNENTSRQVILENSDSSTKDSYNSSSSSSTTSQLVNENILNSTAQSFAGLMPFKVTKRDIEYQKFLLAAMTRSYENEAKANRNNRDIFEIPTHMLNPGDNMIEISPNSGFYLPKQKIAYIEYNSIRDDNKCDWRKLVRETLLEVYGENITNHSATGKRTRPAVNAVLFKALFNWATEKAGKIITRKEFIQCINKCASNKRKYRMRSDTPSRKRQRRDEK